MTRALLFISISLLIAAALIGYLYVYPQFQEWNNLKFELDTKTAAVAQKQAYFSQLINLSVKLAQYQNELDIISQSLPVGLSEPEIYDFFQKLTYQGGLTLQSISSGPGASLSSQSGTIQEISYSLGLRGTYQSFKNYLSELYYNVRFFDVKTISFSASAGESGDNLSSQAGSGTEPIFTFNITLSTYYLQK